MMIQKYKKVTNEYADKLEKIVDNKHLDIEEVMKRFTKVEEKMRGYIVSI